MRRVFGRTLAPGVVLLLLLNVGYALPALGRYEEAVEHFWHLLRVLEQGEEPYRYNKMLCLLCLAQAKRGISADAEALSMVEQAIEHGSGVSLNRELIGVENASKRQERLLVELTAEDFLFEWPKIRVS
jgi:tetratricopeptide (TPR) repeat protein